MEFALTRRGALWTLASAGLSAGVAAGPAPARAQAPAAGGVFDVDVVIVGAGAAGVAAGRELRRLGKSFVILEARNRIGGRTFTDTSLGAPWDAGALYIHWAERNPWTEIARELGVEVIDTATLTTDSRFVDRSADSRIGARARGGGGFRAVQGLFDTEVGPVPDVSLLERVGGPESENASAAMGIARMSLGDEPEAISALDYARLWSGDDFILKQGYGALVQKAAEGLDVRLASPVESIDWSGAGVRVTAASGVVTARAVIVTAPVSLLQREAIRFTPGLPARTRDGLGGLGMGALTKIGLRFNGERFGLTPGLDIWERLGPRASFNFECFTWDRDIVIATFGGDHARDVVRLGEEGAVALALDEFARVIGANARQAFVGGRLAGWSADPWSMGSYSHAKPGDAEARARLAEPVGGRIWFAGEATGGVPGDYGGAMTAGGAALAGANAARAAAAV